jgi:hypothetical protein
MESIPQFGEIQSFLKSSSPSKISKMTGFLPEEGVQQNSVQRESCWKIFL